MLIQTCYYSALFARFNSQDIFRIKHAPEKSLVSKWIDEALSDRYIVEDLLKTGGMSRIFLATDVNRDNKVVVKTPLEESVTDTLVSRFETEARILVELRHPHIVPITDIGKFNGVPYIVLEYLAGGDLKQKLESVRYVRDRVGQLAHWLPQIADALTFIHGKGIVHRDVKPANILFDLTGDAYLADFDITQQQDGTQAVEISETNPSGTAAYMANEIIHGKGDPRSDQYSLAVIVYEQISGVRPFQAPTPMEMAARQVNYEPPKLLKVVPGIPPTLSDAVEKAMSKNPDNRFDDCRKFCDAIKAGCDDFFNQKVAERESDSSPAAFVVGGTALLLLLLAIIFFRGCGN